ncbi:aquaporin Z [[Eubacterium] cellulosolvens]
MNGITKYFAEFFGTFVLVLIGCGSVVIAGESIGVLGIAFAFGLTLMAMIFLIGTISWCHINPAVTIGMFAANKIRGIEAIGYIIMQCFGAIFGAAILFLIASGLPDYSIAVNGLGQNGYGSASPAGYSLIACFTAEVVLTFIFMMVIFGSLRKDTPKGFPAIYIGLTLTFVHLVGIPITGTSVNPARSLGPALFVGGTAINQLWLFWFAPIIGAIIAAIVWMIFTYLFESETGKKSYR